jgi:beta-lactamase regulating signal transducer with metallopeptidase domain
MNFLLNCVIQVTVILTIALTSLPLLRKKSASVRHCVLSTAVVFSILTPAFNAVMPVWDVSAFFRVASQHPAVAPIRAQILAMTSSATRVVTQPLPGAETGAADAVPRTQGDGAVVAVSFPRLLLLLWASGSLVGLIVLLAGVARLAAVLAGSVPVPDGTWRRLAGLISSEYGLKSVVHLLESRNSSVLVTWGALRPRVVLPAGSAEWPEQRARIVLRHELAHIRRGDWIVQMIAQTLRILYWFNPVVWIVCRRLRLESECACDDTVLADDIKGHEYAEHLLDLARVLNRPGQSWSAALTMARPSTIERRFSVMLNPGLNRCPVTRFALLSMVFTGLAITLFLSAASTATPIRTTAASPLSATSEATIMPERAPTAVPISVPAPIESAATPGAEPAPVEPGPPAISIVAEGTQNWALGMSFQRRRGSALDRALFEVAEEGEIADIDELLRAGANVNAVIIGDGTPLMAAAGDGHLEAVQLLLNRGADPNLAVPGDGNALIVAASEGHIDVVRLLLDRGADPNAAVPGDGNPLIAAASEGHADIVALLLDRGANIDQTVPGDENALIQASAEGHLNVVRLLVSRRADVNARVWSEGNPWRAGEWRTPLSVARREREEDIVQFLISVGARD